MTITPAQCRAARALVEMDQAALAEASSVSRNTIVSFEKGQRVPGANNLAAVERALMEAGVVFVAENGGGPGVRLRKPMPPPPLTIPDLEFRIRDMKLPAGARWRTRPDGVDLFLTPDSAEPEGSINIVDGKAAFEPEVPLGRDWTTHLWPTINELTRWLNVLQGALPASFPIAKPNASNEG